MVSGAEVTTPSTRLHEHGKFLTSAAHEAVARRGTERVVGEGILQGAVNNGRVEHGKRLQTVGLNTATGAAKAAHGNR